MQEIRGYIARWGSSRMPKKFTFTFMIPKLNELQSKRVERGRRFVIDSLDFFFRGIPQKQAEQKLTGSFQTVIPDTFIILFGSCTEELFGFIKC